MAETSAETAVAVAGLRKAFGATVAVDDVSFEIERGSVHALLGENGAGKSTIVKLLSGLIAPDAGTIDIFGEAARLRSPRDAHALGVQTAFQEMTLVRDLTVLDNMLLPYAPMGVSGLIRRGAARANLREHFKSLDFEVDLDADVTDLDLAVQQKIEIARAIYRKPKLLLLDEPTSTLAGRDVDWLGELIARLKRQGVTIVFISHRMREVRAFCDRLTILRNGRHIRTGAITDFTEAQVVEMIVGRTLSQAFPARPAKSGQPAPEVLAVRDLACGRKLKEANFTLHKGEILGVAGLQGMGQLDLFLACVGMSEIHGGTILVDGRPVTLSGPSSAIRRNIGIGLLPEDRKTEALFQKLSGKHNASLPVIHRFTRGGIIVSEKETDAVGRVFDGVEVDRRALYTPVSAFSGGNQQKIAVAKWLLAQSRILLLFDPTRGIDVGTKHELYVLMREFANAGGSILFHSTEIPELVHLCDRVVVLYAGRVAAEVAAKDLSERAIMWPALGGDSAAEGAAA